MSEHVTNGAWISCVRSIKTAFSSGRQEWKMTRTSRAAVLELSRLGDLIGESIPMHDLYALIQKVSQTTSPVLLLGETGTGKELVAHCIHSLGPRRHEMFIPVDCSALSPFLVESELFGHVKGAFTGADRPNRGLFQAAHRGTIFFDEIG